MGRKYDFDLNQQLRKSFKKKKLILNDESKEAENTKLKHGMKGGDLKILKPDQSDILKSKELASKIKSRPKPLAGLDSLKSTLKVNQKPSVFNLKQKKTKSAALNLIKKNNPLLNTGSIFDNAKQRLLTISDSPIRSNSSTSSRSSSLGVRRKSFPTTIKKKKKIQKANTIIVID